MKKIKSIMLFVFSAGILLIIKPADLIAQNKNVQFRGVISDSSTGERLSYAIIQLLDAESRKIKGGTTADERGYYNITVPYPGSYLLRASLIGYKQKEEKINAVSGSGTTTLNFQLNKSTVQLDEVTIKALRESRSSVSTVKVSADLVKQLPSMSGEVDVYKALTMLPGVTSASEISNGLYIRGGSPDQTLTLIDGIIVYNPFHLGGFASTFNSDAIEDIKLIKGGSNAEYGGRLSSVLDIKLKDGNPDKFKGNGGLGLISSRFSIEGPLSSNVSYLISARRMYLNSIQNAFMKESNVPFYNFYDANSKLTLKLNTMDVLSMSGYIGKDALVSPPGSNDAAYDINWSNSFINLNWLNVPEKNKYTRLSLTYTGYKFNTLIQDKSPYAFRQDFYASSSIRDFTLKAEGQYLSTEAHTPKLGIELLIHNFDLINNNFYISGLETDERIKNTIIGIEAAAFIQDEWKVTPLLNLNMGLRLYGFPKGRYFRPEPRISVSYALTDRVFLKAAYAEANQFLHLIVRNDVVLPTDMWVPSTALIKPSAAKQAVAGVDFNSSDLKYLFTVEGYYKTMKNLYEYSDTAMFSYEQSIESQLTPGKGNAYGIEFFLNKRTGDITGWIGYTLSWTKRQFDGLNGGKEFYPRYDKRHDISIVLSYRLSEAWNLGLTWTYGTGQAYTMPTGQYYFPGIYSRNEGKPQVFLDYTRINDYRLPAFHKLDLSAKYSFTWFRLPCDLSLSVYNVYNRQNPFARYINYRINPDSGEIKPLLKQFTLFPVLPTLSFNIEF